MNDYKKLQDRLRQAPEVGPVQARKIRQSRGRPREASSLRPTWPPSLVARMIPTLIGNVLMTKHFAAHESPRSPQAAQFPIRPITTWSSNPRTKSSAASTKIPLRTSHIAAAHRSANLLTRDEARRIAANIAKQPEFGRFARDQRCGVDNDRAIASGRPMLHNARARQPPRKCSQ
jgi:hypothetical protein